MMQNSARMGKLYVVGTPIGNLGDLSPRVGEAFAAADAICCEDTRVTSKLLMHLGISKPLVRCDENVIASRAAGLADRCEVELAYAIGVSKPLSIMVDTFGTAHVAEDKIVEAIEKTFDLRPGAIIRDLDLRRPIYEKTAAYGHFGREDADFTWEKTDRVEELKAACGL
jgi:hypothetical protein